MLLSEVQIINSELKDLDLIFQLFENAILYQKKNNYELWPTFSQELIANEIKENRHWKIVHYGTIVCVFSIMYNDPVIWKEKDLDPSVYLHRIAINPLFKGKRITNVIRNWSIKHAKTKHKKFVRMDTWGNKESLKKYYINCGFNYIGQQQLQETEDIPSHYGGNFLSLFQIEV